MKPSPLLQTFVLHFGEMGSRWGINRTVGQIYALIYVSEQPMNADQIVDQLGFSRSNVALGLKELAAMNLLILRHLPQDRKDYYVTHDDVWEIVRNLIEARKKREIDPTLSMLRGVMLETSDHTGEQYAQEKIREMHDLIEMLVQWYDDMQRLDTERLVNLLSMGSKVYRLYQMKDKLNLLPGGKPKREKGKTDVRA